MPRTSYQEHSRDSFKQTLLNLSSSSVHTLDQTLVRLYDMTSRQYIRQTCVPYLTHLSSNITLTRQDTWPNRHALHYHYLISPSTFSSSALQIDLKESSVRELSIIHRLLHCLSLRGAACGVHASFDMADHNATHANECVFYG